MNQYLQNGHMSLIRAQEAKPKLVNYLSHHAVVKPGKSTTKLRVVFNASAKGSKGLSLNDVLLTGPKLQKDINTILLKFRFHPIVFLADIKQMYLQINLTPEHRDFQRLLWRFDPNDPVEEYRLNTVTFGVSSSPFLAIRTLQELASLEKHKYPEAAQVLLEDTFVDDICSGTSDLESALSLQKDMMALLKCGGFELRKWASNHPQLLSSLSPEECQIPVSFDREEPLSIKVLGLQWDPSSDKMFFACEPSDKPCTKRNILSEIARIFDPLGFLSPVSFCAKHLMQRLWLSKTGWDEPVEQSIQNRWSQIQSELPGLAKILFPRYVFSQNILRCQLHGFSDASELGYAAAVYLRIESPEGVIQTSLIIGKARVAPLKSQSVPRLELLGATLLSNLLQFVMESYTKLAIIDEVFAYTDSQVVLAWIASSPHRWKSFVANRVSHIQETIPNVKWYHVSTHENPADCASRGLTPASLADHPLWFQGPPWLLQPSSSWNRQTPNSCGNQIAAIEERCPILLTALIEDHILDTLLDKYSSLSKIQKILCQCLRVFHNYRHKSSPLTGAISSFELQNALLLLSKRAQQRRFSGLIAQIRNNELVSKSFRPLAPFLDKEGLVRVGGRLRHAHMSFEAKHPVLLPRDHPFTRRLIEQVHQDNLHPGLNTVQNLLRQQFWILSTRRAIQSVLSRCIRCFRLRPKAYTPYMGDLPSFRISQLKCFSHATLDYAGPFNIVMGRYRGAKVLKAYICVFVCCATRAVHIELTSDLTSEAFIGAFRRFISRRGRVTHLYSDNGTTFVGANTQLIEMSQLAADHLQILWHFNPPAAPHFNGLSEAGVKAVKTHLYRVIGDQRLTYEELNTFLAQVEAVLNSRPLCAQSSDPNDLQPLTPGHFLTQKPLNSCPDPDLSHLKLNTLSRWQLVQRLNAEFWKRWKDEYLHTLQQRSKWTQNPSKITLDQLVIIKHETKPPLHWALGRVVELHPGPDGHVRVVTLRTQQGLFKRPIVKLCPLPIG